MATRSKNPELFPPLFCLPLPAYNAATMASDPTKTGQAVCHGPHSWVQHACPDPAVFINHTVAGRPRPPTGLPGLDTTNEQSVALWFQQRTAPAVIWNRTPSTTAFYKSLLVRPSQPHLPSVDRRPTSDTAAPHLVHGRVLPVLHYPSNLAIYHYPPFRVILMVILLIFIIEYYPKFRLKILP